MTKKKKSTLPGGALMQPSWDPGKKIYGDQPTMASSLPQIKPPQADESVTKMHGNGLP